MYDFKDDDRGQDDPTREQIIERCKAIRKENLQNRQQMEPQSFERGMSRLLTDVYQSPVYIPHLRFYDW